MVEMVFMGVGSKVFWDIVFSEEVINDRNINYVLKRRGSRYFIEGGVRWRLDFLLLLVCVFWLF